MPQKRHTAVLHKYRGSIASTFGGGKPRILEGVSPSCVRDTPHLSLPGWRASKRTEGTTSWLVNTAWLLAVFFAPRRTRFARTPPAGPDRLSNAQIHLACCHVRQRVAECTSITQAVSELSNSYDQELRRGGRGTAVGHRAPVRLAANVHSLAERSLGLTNTTFSLLSPPRVAQFCLFRAQL